MKKWACVLIVVLLLCGCTEEFGKLEQIPVLDVNVEDRDQVAAALGIQKGKIREVIYMRVDNLPEPTPGDQSDSERITVENVVRSKPVCLSQKMRDLQYQNPSAASASYTLQNKERNHYWHAQVANGISLDVETVKRALGYDVEGTVEGPGDVQIELQPGETAEVITIPICECYTFEVYKKTLLGEKKLVGEGCAYRIVGYYTFVCEY